MSSEQKKASAVSDTSDNASSADGLFMVFRTIGDTTWRMFVPPAIGAFVGWQIDARFNTRYAALIGTVVGAVLAGLLVWQQYKTATGRRTRS